MAKVFIGVGHGGSDPGAVSGAFLEKELNLDIALSCAGFLKAQGVDCLLSRTTDENDTLEEEIRECNQYAPDLALDIHNNAGGGDGAEVYYHVGGGTSKQLAEAILSQIVAIGQNSRGAKVKTNAEGQDWFGFIRETAAPAVIVECAFLDHPEDVLTVDTKEERIQMGEAIGKGILQVLGIPLRESEETPTDSKEEVDLIFPPPSPEDPTKETEEKEGMKKVLRGLLIRFLKSLLEWLEKA